MFCIAMTIFLAALGACIGSFLNVVIYRLPRGLSVRQPRRSFCPFCRQQIRWYDNIPVASWIALRGRCRICGHAISLQYPLVEATCIVLTVLVWHAVRTMDVTASVEQSWPVLAGMLGLFWCLLGLSAMDLEEYYVDIRLTWFALGIGLICHAIGPAKPWPAGEYATAAWAAFAVGCTMALAILHWLWPTAEVPVDEAQTAATGQQCLNEPAPPDAGVLADLGAAPSASQMHSEGTASSESSAPAAAGPVSAHGGSVRAVSLLAIVALAVVAFEAFACQTSTAALPGRLLLVTGLATLFGAILAASWLPTEADAAIAQAVESERPMAVRQATQEAVVLAVVCLAGLGLLWLIRRPAILCWYLSVYDWTVWGQWRPVAGLGTALLGWIVTGGACWLVRVLFTMVLRKEALGFGDIHIMAAAGAVMGPQLGIAGFFLSAPVAILGTLVLVFRKRYRTLPFGPWLSLGFLLALLWGIPLIRHIDAALGAMALLLSGGASRPLY